MSSKIAVIGSNEFIEKIHPVAAEISDLEIEPYIYQKPQEASGLVKNLKPCDAIFFSGALPYYFSKEHLKNLNIPSLFLAQDEMAIAASLLTIIYKKNIQPERISIDLLDSDIAANVFAESEIMVSPLWVMDYKSMLEDEFDLDRIVHFHQSLWNQGMIDIALTSVHAVYHRLKNLGIPAMRMADPRVSLLRGLQTAQNQAELLKRKSAQIAVGYIEIQSELQEQKDMLTHTLQSYVQPLSETLYVVYSTRGEMEPDRLHNFLVSWKGTITVGFGYGTTIKEADQHAKIALRFAEKEDLGRCGYILTDDKEMIGPFPLEQKQHSLKSDHPEILTIAKQTKLSPANLSKIIEFSKGRQTHQFTAADLTEYLQVTRRSTERILKKLADNGYLKIVGEEMVYHQGRPRAIYELDIPIYQ